MQRIKEVKENHLELANEKKIRRLTEQLETFSPKFIKSKDVVLDKIDLDFKAKFFKIKKTVPEVNNEDLETSKNSVKSFRIRNKRSISDIRENSINIGQSINKQQILINQKMEMKAMLTNKHLLHNKMQKRPDTTGAKNRDKKFVVIEKTQQKLQEDKDSNSNIIVDNNKIITKIDIALHKSNNEKEINKNIDIQVNEKENFKEELNEKQKCDHEEAKNQINNPLDIKKEFSTDLFDEFKFGELLGEGLTKIF